MPMRISGMSSGMDIDKIVKDLMKAERTPLTKINQQKTLTTWKMGLYREINAKLIGFRSVLGDMRLSGDWKATKAISTHPAVTVSSDGSAAAKNHTIVVDRLASGAMKSSSSPLSGELIGKSLAAATSINNNNNKFEVTFNGNKKTITLIPNASYTPAALKDEINAQISAAFGSWISVSLTGSGNDQLKISGAGQIVLTDSVGSSALTSLGFPSGSQRSNRLNPGSAMGLSGKLVINGTSVSVLPGDSLSSMITKVNTSAAGVSMSYDVTNDKVTFASKDIGSMAKVDLTGTDNFILSGLKLADSKTVHGQDANVNIDGIQYLERSNTFTKDGITYTLNQTTTPSTVVNVSVKKDTDALYSKIVDFVSKYNDMVDTMGKRLNENKYRGFHPLSDDEKKDMKEAEIKQWEDKAKSGLIRRDDTVYRALKTLRKITGESVEGMPKDYNSLDKIGISTMPFNPNKLEDNAKLKIDEKKLKTALADKPESVIALFTNNAIDPALPPSEKNKQKGIAHRMYDEIGSSSSELIRKAGHAGAAEDDINSTLGATNKAIERKIITLESKMKKKEDFYYAKFAHMEKAIQKSNANLSWLSKRM
ncbi:flagellar filament capping protein FliD [Paenibacillus tyrfis]|uniref:flagellar filament capping protein FliD n=1 Tax=Paenibacillus tyrfis TaxID=1501230 RepID=UPI00209F7D3A|nr:flagellar filament capping protein FliD [Paenibacillus tyrfis]MCP1312404.1 flagellar filament capping protein FliD [Paenibacillus tyrfis]